MATDYGPAMLRSLDRKLASGEIDSHTHEARRAILLEDIRKRRTIELSVGEKLTQIAITAVGVVVAILILAMYVSSGGNLLIG